MEGSRGARDERRSVYRLCFFGDEMSDTSNAVFRALVIAVFFAGCELAPLDVTGLACDDADQCGDGFVCFGAKCIRPDDVPEVDAGIPDAGVEEEDAGVEDAGITEDAGVPDAGSPDAGLRRDVNLLANPGFEMRLSDGGVASWRASTGRLVSSTQNRSGSRSAKLISSNTNQQMVMVPSADQSGTEIGMLFCASAWVRAENGSTVDVTLTLRDRYFDGGFDSSAGVRFTATDQWRQVKEQHISFGKSTLQYRLQSVTRFDAGDGFFVDDTVLLLSSGDQCP